MVTLLEIISDALSKIYQLGIGQSIAPEQAQQGFREANRMVAHWSIQRLMLYTVTKRPFVLSVGVQDYTVGLGAGATFNQARPDFVEGAQGLVYGTSLEKSMNLLDVVKWGAIFDKQAQCGPDAPPSDVWPEYSYPNLTFHVWPVPTSAVTINLRTWEQLQQFTTLMDELNFPPGYEMPLVDNLAMRLASYYEVPVSQDLAAQAAQGLLKIQGINAQSIGGSIGPSRTLQAPNLDVPAPPQTPPGVNT